MRSCGSFAWVVSARNLQYDVRWFLKVIRQVAVA